MVSSPTYIEKIKFFSTKELPIHETQSTFRPVYMKSSFVFNVPEIETLFNLLQNKTIVNLAEAYVQKVKS